MPIENINMWDIYQNRPYVVPYTNLSKLQRVKLCRIDYFTIVGIKPEINHQEIS